MSDEDISLTDVRTLIRDIWQIKDKNDAILDMDKCLHGVRFSHCTM